ncbi:Sodium/hydrogen exchanger family-domain-containing protein [Polychytrium aggregatum]|uniref:Sodium/hydrogen exchanger family-domain-containing protein n=1 Tax=Polychytrium aggregatum TaxID=110093 RepID=UPI0022FF3EFD|nr:Sodium/hydrogen exchanger family-domain-containing protein [Polychytrium aggregatum]KAI9208590.1 Sodium/hydrogen exchanger family-domain-containing protein [Polychytrium aggregatum]
MTTNTTVAEAVAATAEEEQHALFIRAILLLSLIVVVMNVNLALKKAQFHYVGESAVMILTGLLAAMCWIAFSYDQENVAIQLSSKFFYMGGFSLKRLTFFKNVLLIIALAFLGALYSTFVTSGLMYFFSKLISPWSFVESLVFGSLISSTDPVTVLSLLPPTVDKRLYILIFGESALNDAVAIILYRFFTDIADPKMRLSATSLVLSVLQSAWVFLGSFAIGIILGLIFAKITKHIRVHEDEATTYESVMLIVFAYTSYLLADVLGLTGIISIFFCGIAMAHYAYPNLSPESASFIKSFADVFLRVIGHMCESFIFIYLGLGLLSFGGKTTYSPLMILFACISILVSRTHIFLILGSSNLIHRRNPETAIPFNQQVLMWFSGLRGAVAFALGVTFLEHPVFDADVKGMIFGTTVMVVVITVIILGGLTPYMLKWLKISSPDAGDVAAGAAGAVAEQHTSTKEITKRENGEEYKMLADGDEHDDDPGSGDRVVYGWLQSLDMKYIRPLFTMPKSETEEKAKAPEDENATSRYSLTRKASLTRASLSNNRKASVARSTTGGFSDVEISAVPEQSEKV